MLATMSAVQRKIYNRLPQWLKRHDFEVFAAVAAIFSGLPIIFDQVEPSSIEALLPRPLVVIWAFVLLFGGISVLAGIIMASRTIYPTRSFWMRIEALGLTGFAYFCYIYTLCIFLVVPTRGWTVAVFILTFGVICHVRRMAVFMELDDYRRNIGVVDTE